MHDTDPPARVVGQGPIRMLVSHGWISDSQIFLAFEKVIDPARYTIAFVDHRGYGSRRNQAAVDLETSLLDLLRVADDLGWPTFHVIGHSMGGLVAQRLCVSHPDRLESAILLSPVPAQGAQLDDGTRRQWARAAADPAERRALIRRNTSGTEEFIDAVWHLSLDTVDPQTLCTYLEDWSRADFGDQLKGCDIPFLIATGAEDYAVPMDLLRRTLEGILPSAQFVRLSDVGHYAMLQDPDRLFKTIDKFVRSLSGNSAEGTQ